MASGPLVSIVIPCFNQGQYLSESVGSALAQTYPDVEVVIVDDASSAAGTATELAKLEKEGYKIVRLQPNQGLPAARNAGIAVASGVFILPLDADDVIDPTYVERAVALLSADGNLGIAYAQGKLFGESEGQWELPPYSIGQELAGNCIHCCGLFRKSDWQAVGGYDEGFRSGLEDWDLWLGIIALGRGVAAIPERLFSYRIHSDSFLHRMSEEDKRAATARVFRKHIGLYVEHAEEFLSFVDTEIANQFERAVRSLTELERQRNDLLSQLDEMGQTAERARIQSEKAALELGLAREKAKADQARLDQEVRERERLGSENMRLSGEVERARATSSALRSAWSFRIGLLLTWPLRFAYETLSRGPRAAYRVTVLPHLPAALRRLLDRMYVGFSSARPISHHFVKTSSSGPLVSVVIPVYDRTADLHASISSILVQTFQDFEIVLVTDGSPPETLEVLHGFEGNPKVRIFEYPDNTGNAVRGRNRGIAEARGKYVAFQDSDDIAEPRRLEWSVASLEEGTADVVYGGWRARLDGTRQVDGLVDGQEVFSPGCDLETLLRICVPCQSTVMVRRDALLDVGGLKPAMEYREDHELWCRLAFFGYRFQALHAILTNLKLHGGNNELKFHSDSQVWHQKLLESYRIKPFFSLSIAFVLPGVGISGGIYVVFEHAVRLMRAGHRVTMLTRDPVAPDDLFWHPEASGLQWTTYDAVGKTKFDLCFATWWQTVYDLPSIPAHHYAYFNQSVESRFYGEDEKEVRASADRTYEMPYPIVTVAGWIQDFVRERYDKYAYLVRNGIRKELYTADGPSIARREEGKLRVVVEGPLSIPFKNVRKAIDLCQGIADEIWLLTATPIDKVSGVDRVFSAVAIGDVPLIYRSCDVLVKLSAVESFGFPPLEMFHCGGTAIVSDVPGHNEYVRDGSNALMVDVEDDEGVKAALRRLKDDPGLLARLKSGAMQTAREWPDWEVSHREFLQAINGILSDIHSDP